MAWLWIRDAPSVANQHGTVRIGPLDEMVATSARGMLETTLPALGGETLAQLYVADRYVLIATEKGAGVWRVTLPELVLAGVDLERLDFEGGYDPGGMHHLGFTPLPDGGLLVSCEWSLARLDRDGTARWTSVPGEYLVTRPVPRRGHATVGTIDATVVVDLATGAVVERRPTRRSAR